MWKSLWSGPERRRRRRHDLELEIKIEIHVEIYGFEPTARPFFASGTTVNVSEAGLMARIDAPIAAGSVCNIFFRECHDQVRPLHTSGNVQRCDERDGSFYVAVALDAPLLELTVETLAMVSLPTA